MITGYGATIVDGAWLTLQLALLSMLLAIRANGKYKEVQDKYFDFDVYGE